MSIVINSVPTVALQAPLAGTKAQRGEALADALLSALPRGTYRAGELYAAYGRAAQETATPPIGSRTFYSRAEGVVGPRSAVRGGLVFRVARREADRL